MTNFNATIRAQCIARLRRDPGPQANAAMHLGASNRLGIYSRKSLFFWHLQNLDFKPIATRYAKNLAAGIHQTVSFVCSHRNLDTLGAKAFAQCFRFPALVIILVPQSRQH